MKAYLLALGAALLFAAGPAGAADVIYEPQPAPQPYVTPAPVAASGWYLRGDVGYAFDDLRGVEYQTATGGATFDTAEVKDNFLVGLGIGYQISRHFRADFTGDYTFKSSFTGTTSGVCPGGGACSSVETGKVSLLSLLANAYVDFGTWHNITPYVGAGIGATYVDWGGLSSVSNCSGAGCTPNSSYNYNGESDWRFTYALMVGASVDLTCNLKFDAGYRFRHIDGGNMFSGAPGITDGRDDGFNINEVRGGLRYTFGGCQPQPVFAAYEPEPVYK